MNTYIYMNIDSEIVAMKNYKIHMHLKQSQQIIVNVYVN